MDIVRGIGWLALLMGVAGVLTRSNFGRSFKFYPSSYSEMQSFWRWSGRIGVVLLGVGSAAPRGLDALRGSAAPCRGGRGSNGPARSTKSGRAAAGASHPTSAAAAKPRGECLISFAPAMGSLIKKRRKRMRKKKHKKLLKKTRWQRRQQGK